MRILYLFISFIFFISCLPSEGQRPAVTQTENIENGKDNGSTTTTNTLPEATNFIQVGSSKTTSTLNLDNDFNDSYLIRGNNIIERLEQRVLFSQENYCLVNFFPNVNGSGNKNILITSARIRFFYNNLIDKKEYFLQVEPNNESINQTDCLTVSLTTKLQTMFNSNSFAFKLEDVCPNCSNSITSDSIRIFEKTGLEEQNIALSFLFLNISPSQQSSGGGNSSVKSCLVDSNCTALNFDCCLNGQCVDHGEARSGIDQSSNEFLIAQQIIQGEPVRIKDYPHLFYLCPSMIAVDDPPSNDIDPIQISDDLFSELQRLYQCTTLQQDEFSLCTKEFNNATALMSGGPFSFSGENDDINFSNIVSTSTLNNITQIQYAGAIFYKEALTSSETGTPLDPGITLGNPNDSLTAAQTASFQKTKPFGSTNDSVYITYRVDGTCEKLGASLAKCSKFYNQGQSSTPPRSSDHSASSQIFSIPSYADTSLNVIVKVNGSIIAEGIETWSLNGRSVEFNSASFPIFTGQDVTIEYYVTSNVSGLTNSKTLAQDRINTHCKCDPQKDPCSLEPVMTSISGVETITSFSCKYPEPNIGEIPLQRTLFVSAKSVPHKYFDEFGVNVDLGDDSSNNSQEGEKFEYTDGNRLKPNNVTKYIGFNEIYGSMNIDGASPLPPKVVAVEKGKSYDVFIDEGAFSTCLDCGSDYYSGLQKVFPHNFNLKGGGYEPAIFESRRRTNQSAYPSDDFKFGRACFLPATMIPWTHRGNPDPTTQRRDRLDAQHFLFANGYNKDWFGFDYGALIGSFDGVEWFAIGNQRKFLATGNKLYLAVNAYFGDLTISNSFKVTINEIQPVSNSGSLVTHNTDNDGAQCQRSHFCSIDEDCITQLGYDYTCQNVASLETPWPTFDQNGNEVAGSISRTLLSLTGGSNGQVKRCVYRGRGSICEPRSFSVSESSSYTNSDNPALHTCSANSYCENLNQNAFNSKISRYAETPRNQNAQSFITDKTDTFGLATRIIGRPYEFYGTDSTPVGVRLNLNQNNVNALCIPGKDIDNITNTQDLNQISINQRQSDKISAVGRTMSSIFAQNENYFAACPATDENGNYTHFTSQNLNDDNHNPFAVRSNISTNSLILNALSGKGLFNDSTTQVTDVGYHKNTCLRAPGAKCFSDFECSANSFISTKFKSVSNFNGEISSAEEGFWEEELICGNSQDRLQAGTTFPNPVYDTTTHKCCMETSKEFTYKSMTHENSEIETVDLGNGREPLIPGLNQDINDPKRYSRTHVVYDKLKTERSKYPNMLTATPRPTNPLRLVLDELRQYNTLHLHNQRMCCTGNWVRKFASGSNAVNGGTKFSGTTQQNIPIETFKPLSFSANNIPAQNSFPSDQNYLPEDNAYFCKGIDIETSDCEVKNIAENSAFERKYLTWFSKFELIGIPQVLIETNLDVEKPLSTDEEIDVNGDGFFVNEINNLAFDFDGDGRADIGIDLDGDNVNDVLGSNYIDIDRGQLDISSLQLPLDNTIKDINNGGVADVILTENNQQLYSAASYDNFEIGSGKLKRIFSEDQFNCCIPTGFAPDSTTLERSCCSGTANTDQNGNNVCCLSDFADVSVYTNRYVSSEGAFFNGQEVSDADVDPKTGYIKKEIVLQMAKSMCCSGEVATGKVINDYLIPVDVDQKPAQCPKTRRFLFLENLDNEKNVLGGVTKYNAGLKWNNHVYCVPAGFNQEVQADCSSGN